MMNFAQRFLELSQSRSNLCVGVDPSAELLSAWGLSVDAKGLAAFCDIFLEAAGDSISIIKPQSAFFERFGSAGMHELERLLRGIRDRGTLSLLDCKRGDIGHTLMAYAEAMLGNDSLLGADAITVSAYLGFGALRPALDKAVSSGKGVFVVVRSSNPEGTALQNARLEDGRTVADMLADEISRFNESSLDSVGPIGAVMGATLQLEEAKTLERMPRSLFLAPGVGAQGATIHDMANSFGSSVARAIPSVSRGVLAKGPNTAALREAIRIYREEALDILHRGKVS